MPYCTACGTEVGEDQRFCTECGEPIRAGEDTTGGGGAAAAGASAAAETAGDTPATEAAAASSDGATEGEQPTAEEPAEPTEVEKRGRLLAASGIGLTAVGAFLPWITVSILGASETKVGIEGDGVLTLALAIAAGIALVIGKGKPWSKKSRAFVCVLGVLVALLAITYINDPWAFSEDPPSGVMRSAIDVEIGAGLYATALGGALFALGPLYGTFGDS